MTRTTEPVSAEPAPERSTQGEHPASPANPGSSLRQLLGPQLPFLRRYARALAGNQQQGDRFVMAALEAVLADPVRANVDTSLPKLSLFRMFHAFWSPHHDLMQRSDSGAAALDQLPLSGREALLLTAMEEFSIAETAIILGRPATAIAGELDAARAQIAQALRSRVLIIEDEPIIAMHIEQIVLDMGHEVVGTAMTRDDAVLQAREHRPDLVLADIQLADGSSGLDAVDIILAEFNVPVVFITAYPERLLTGQRREPAYLVTKPFNPNTLVATIGQALLAREKDALAA